MTHRRLLVSALAALVFSSAIYPAVGQKKYDQGANDTEIKVGNIMPYSGPLSAYALIGRTEAAFFRMINEQGGVNGRKINFITYDDAFSPPKTVEQARKLVESDEVLLIYQSLGTPTNNAIQKYLDPRKYPSSLWRPVPPSSEIPRISPGPWDGNRPTRPRAGSTPSTSCRTFHRVRSGCSTRMTIPAATTSRA
jgi:hypothetical protein